jgi:hypothetical protein
MRYDRLTILLARTIADQDDYGYKQNLIFFNLFFFNSYFVVNQTGKIERQQTGVFRTNCIDCLDRTNVVQNIFAKRILEKQLQQYNIIKDQETIDSYQQLNNIFKNSKFIFRNLFKFEKQKNNSI